MELRAVCILTSDAPRLAGFYAALLKEEPFVEGSHYTFVRSKLAVYDPGDVKTAEDKNMSVIFETEDVDSEYARLTAELPGIDMTSPPEKRPWGAYSFWLRDPDGNTVSIAEK